MAYELKSIVAARNAAQQQAYAAARPTDLTPARTHVNSAQRATYTGHGMTPARAGADDHKQHVSLGLGAQIKVRTV